MQGLQGQEELDRCGHCSFADGLHNTVSQGVHQYFVAIYLYLFRYIFGTDKLRPNAFEVRGMDGSSTGEEDLAFQ